ncbi:MAG: acetyl-CoA carboxylase biotin carboxyl carrier protein [Gammaproteobacteria bacterium]|nr:acetyl-CoA carboxylase biotin carboxyl carrier protein [Gammaproteobacteria bacterium]
MDIRKVKKLIEMLEESEVSEIEIHEGEESVRISRNSSYAEQPQTVVHVPAADIRPDTVPAPAGEAGKPAASETPPEADGHYITAPMVGIFYGSPAPDKPPFTEHGKQIKVGDVVCIIEAMKIMNQIESDANGVISRVLVENGEPVEYGQPLFQVREA